MRYYCCDQRRREVVKLHGTRNGLEYVEVHDSGQPGDKTRQRILIAKFLRVLQPQKLTEDNLRITGGERVKTVEIEKVDIADELPAGESGLVDGFLPLNEFLVIRTKNYGDFSQYTLSVVSGPGSDIPPADFDPRLSEIQFSFKVQCESDFDCATTIPCLIPPVENPRLDYLAKDYTSFRRLMLDRLSVLMPEWRSRNPADVGVTLVELLAYVGDQLSYQQDAIATEAYLGTARRRTSLRRHARLVDYAVHEGCNARVWVRVFVNDDGVTIPAHTLLLTRSANLPDRLPPESDQLREALASGVVAFETVEDSLLYQAHKRMIFYTWGERECCLPKGTTQATLSEHFPNLKAGDVLILAEERGPRTGFTEDADRDHRWAVRLTHVRLDKDPSGGLFLSVPNNSSVNITEIQWAAQDALPFPLCLTTTITDKDHGAVYLETVSAAYGNIVLADHGYTLRGEKLDEVPASHLTLAPTHGGDSRTLCEEKLEKVSASPLTSAFTDNELSCKRPSLKPVPPRFRPRLAERPLTHALSLIAKQLFKFTATNAVISALQARTYAQVLQDTLGTYGVVLQAGSVAVQGGDGLWSISDGISVYRLQLVKGEIQVFPLADAASLMVVAEPGRARPAISLVSDYQGNPASWQPRLDLLGSKANDTEFVVESEHDGSAYLRFGDDIHGKRPDSGTVFTATYRIGNGTAGNIGLESIAHIVSNDKRLISVSNPLPAQGGVEPESAEEIRRGAPEAFRIQERAVTPQDYAEVAERHPSVQRATATFRWTGSWYTVFLTVDRKGGGEIDVDYEQIIRDHIERYRMAGYDLEVDGPRYVPLELEIAVCVKPDYFRADVQAALMRVFSRGWLPDGSRAVFHPDNFTFGQPVYLSELYEAAHSVQGVASAVIKTFRRLRTPRDLKPLDEGVLTIERLEIARLDNDPNFPERGVLKLSVGGGK
ncbi:putative baseplate assembly protein [Nitrosomonas sp.]|uniref:putative baseplate assembly protein n=1 Tax=Nitrosomonas sp. TaxID=42353 RepID=UPI0037C9C8CF